MPGSHREGSNSWGFDTVMQSKKLIQELPVTVCRPLERAKLWNGRKESVKGSRYGWLELVQVT